MSEKEIEAIKGTSKEKFDKLNSQEGMDGDEEDEDAMRVAMIQELESLANADELN